MLKPLIALFIATAASWEGVLANLIPNADLDQQTQGMLQNWQYADKGWQSIALDKVSVSSTGVKVSRGEDPAGSGHYYLCLETDGKKGDEGLTISSGQYKVPVGFTYALTGEYRAKGLMAESVDRSKYAAGSVFVFCDGQEKRVKAQRILTFSNSTDWTAMSMQIAVPTDTEFVQIRPELANHCPDNPVRLEYRKLVFVPVDYSLPDASFEQTGSAGSYQLWHPYGAATCSVVSSPVHGGSKAVEVKDAPSGLFSGWSAEVPVRPDREYIFKGFAKGGVFKAGGPIGGGALGLQFLDDKGQPLGEPYYSKAIPANSDWTELATLKAVPPKGAFAARLTAGMQYCGGSSWFDDLSLEMNPVAAADAVKVLRPDPKASGSVVYAKNLLKNGDVEGGTGAVPDGWTYVGKSEPNWTAEELKAYYGNGRPNFSIGRGKGEWSHSTVYAGKGALLNISVDPPLSTKTQWFGRNQVDGYWFSEPMPCTPGKPYIAGAWLRPGAMISEAWYGPLEIQFFDKAGKITPPARGVRSMLNAVPANEWGYWFTPPFVAPQNATTMRLRFGQELAADTGGWGRTYADNLAVWELPPQGDLKAASQIMLNNLAARAWFTEAHAKVKPPYMPSPAEAAEYESVWGTVLNTVPGNVFSDPKAETKLRLSLFNALGEDRTVSVKAIRTDWKGNASSEFVVPGVVVPAFSQGVAEILMPPTGSYGAFHVECSILEGPAKVGVCSGRYAVIPPAERKRTQENIWAVTLLRAMYAENSAAEMELAQVLRIAGFGIGWVRDGNSAGDAWPETQFFRSAGIKVALQLTPPLGDWTPQPTFNPTPYYEYGRRIATRYKGLVIAYGDWGIEQSNNRTVKDPVYRPMKNGTFLSDKEYDQIWCAIHDGIRSVDKDTPILIGNIATDFEADAIKRMYGAPVNGRFDGAILNAYMGVLTVAQNSLAEFDRHGDTTKCIWQEENADQRSPITGSGRRYGEGDGASNMVRTWVSLACKCYPRIRSVTQWGFAAQSRLGDMADATMMDIGLQPRPQFVAHAIMADALADAQYVGDRSTPAMTLYEFKRSDGALIVAWANAGERDVTFETGGHDLTALDIMGNRTRIESKDGLGTVKLGTSPLFISGPAAISISERLELTFGNSTQQVGRPQVALTLRNNQTKSVSGQIVFSGPLDMAGPASFSLEPGTSKTVPAAVKGNLAEGKPTTFRAECRTSEGAVFSSSCSANFAQAIKTNTPSALDGTWQGWSQSPAISFGEPWQAVTSTNPAEAYRGKDDIFGHIRMMWDDNYFYLGVEALDDIFLPQSSRGMNGFMGDSIEFAFQPDNVRTSTASLYEYELYLPRGKGLWAASRRSPRPTAMIESGWKGIVTPTRSRGNVNYQIAIPWKDLGIDKPTAGKVFSMALILNDADTIVIGGGRKRIKWFDGIDSAKSPEKFGEVTLVVP